MRRLLILLLSLALSFSVCLNAGAVDKKSKKNVTKSKVVKKQAPVSKKGVAKKTTGKKAGVRTKKPIKGKKYDTFIDKNGNGIDDRKEKLVKKAGKQSKKKPDKKKK